MYRTKCKKTRFCRRVVSLTIVISVIFVLLTACSQNEKTALPVVSDYRFDPVIETKNLRVGFVLGPYMDMFVEAILPQLIEMGYTTELKYYQDYRSPNLALAHDEIDLNIFQHYLYLNNFKFDNDLALSAIMTIPTASMGIFSHRYDSLDELRAGSTVSVPNDVSNLARALTFLEAANILRLNPGIEKSKATLADIVSNPHNLRFVPTGAHNLVDSLNACDLSVINGNYAISGGLNPSEALDNEALSQDYTNVIAVRTEDLNKQYVRDIIDIIYSDLFRDVIMNPAGKYADFQLPRWFFETE